MINLFNKNISVFSFTIILIFFSPLFYYSFEYILNIWAYSDAFVNYSQGFIRRGLLGEIIINIHKFTNFKIFHIHSSIFLFITILNIILYINLLKKISDDRLVYFFLIFNPAIILFPLYDTGGYLRKELFVITSMLIHTTVCSKFHNNKISINYYNKFLLFFNIPLIVTLTLNHGIQFFLIPFHFFLSLNIYNSKFNILKINDYFKKENLYLSAYLFTLIPLFYFLLNPVELNQLKLIYNNVVNYDKNILSSPIYFLSVPLKITIVAETKNMFQSLNAIKTYFTIICFSILPIFLFFNFYIKKNIINVKNYYFIFLTILPICLMFFIGRDWGRWINLIAFTTLLFFMQFKVKKNFNFNFFEKTKNIYYLIFKFIVFMCMLYYLIFMMVPHCCNNTNYHMGGLFENLKMAYEIFFGDFENHLNNTFRKN